jgi:gas vesicle protein
VDNIPQKYVKIAYALVGTIVLKVYYVIIFNYKQFTVMSNNSNKLNIVIGIAAAAAVGAAIGFMFAPEKGADLRQKVKKNANSWADELLAAINKGKDTAQQLADETQSKAKSWKNKAKDELEDAAELAESKVNSLS